MNEQQVVLCRKCHSELNPAESACYQGLCENCWVGDTPAASSRWMLSGAGKWVKTREGRSNLGYGMRIDRESM